MAEELEYPAQIVQHEDDTNKGIVERGEPLEEDTDGHEKQGEASSLHSRPHNETSRPEEDEAERTKPPDIYTSTQTFKCWYDSSRSSEIEDFICGESACPMSLWPMSL